MAMLMGINKTMGMIITIGDSGTCGAKALALDNGVPEHAVNQGTRPQ